MQVYACWVHTTSSNAGLQLQETLGRVFGQLARLIARRHVLDPQAMSRTDYAILAMLEHCPDDAGQRTSHLAAAHGHDVSTISRRVNHLETHGLLERLPDPSDRRASTVRLTSAGRTALAQEREARAGLLQTVLGDWPEADLADLDRLLTRLSSDLAADSPAAASPSPTTARTTA